MEELKVGSGFTRKFFVVRRALDACLLEDNENGRRERDARNERLASGRKGIMEFMLLLRFSRKNNVCLATSSWEKVEAWTAGHVIGSQLRLDHESSDKH